MDFPSLDFLVTWFDQVTEFVAWIWEFFTNGIYDFFKEALSALTKVLIYSYLQTQLFAIEIAHDAVMSLLDDVGVIDQVDSAFGSLPAEVRSGLSFFRIPESVGVIFSAFATRWAMAFVPFVGR